MTDRAKKISELTTTTSVANTDKIVVLKDAANSSLASTKAMTITNFANSIGPLIRLDLANSTVTSNTVTVQSNGTSSVAFFTFANNDVGHVDFHAKDNTTGDITAGHFTLVSNSTVANLALAGTTSVGPNQILFDNAPTINVSTGVVTLYFRRESAASTNVVVKYIATLY
jgi:hypothetical protein